MKKILLISDENERIDLIYNHFRNVKDYSRLSLFFFIVKNI